MGRVKSFYHDEICGRADDLRDHLSLRDAVRITLAREVGKSRHVADILDGKWDDTPAFRKLFGEMWLLEQGADTQSISGECDD